MEFGLTHHKEKNSMLIRIDNQDIEITSLLKLLSVLEQYPREKDNIIKNFLETHLDDLIYSHQHIIRGELEKFPQLKEIFITYIKQNIRILSTLFRVNASFEHNLRYGIKAFPELTLEFFAAALFSEHGKSLLACESSLGQLANFDSKENKKRMLEYLFTEEIWARHYDKRIFVVLPLFLQVFAKQEETHDTLKEFFIERLRNNSFFIINERDMQDLQLLPPDILEAIKPLMASNPSCWEHFEYGLMHDPVSYMDNLQKTYPQSAAILSEKLPGVFKSRAFPVYSSVASLLIATQTFPQHKGLIAKCFTINHMQINHIRTIEDLKQVLAIFSDISDFKENLMAIYRNNEAILFASEKDIYQYLCQPLPPKVSQGGVNFFTPSNANANTSGEGMEIDHNQETAMEIQKT